jgi:AmmeMemoRadiSam system protein B
MTMTMNNPNPRLRPVDMRPIQHEGQDFVLLRDPTELADETILVPQPLATALAFFDGSRDLPTISSLLAIRYGIMVGPQQLGELAASLDDFLFLETPRAEEAQEAALAAYRRALFRQPSLAGVSYPEDPGELRMELQNYFDQLGVTPETNGDFLRGMAGVVSPHIDYARGWRVYAQVWSRIAGLARAADLVVILGTDHYGGGDLFTLTRQNYATPFGVLPTDTDLVDALASELGEEAVFAGEIRHQGEHSIELAAVWLHFIREGKPCQLLPVLCGSFYSFVQGEGDPAVDDRVNLFLDKLQALTKNRRTLVVAAGDLAHVGPAFGGEPLNRDDRAHLESEDRELLTRMCAGDAPGFFQAIRQVEDRNNICGLAPIYLTLRALGGVDGEPAGYELCPADAAGTSVVSVCGVTLHG